MLRYGTANLLNFKQAAALGLQSPKVARNRISDALSGNRNNTFPRNISLHLANRCNMACPMCSIGQARADREDEFAGDMPYAIVEKAVTEAARHGAYIDLFGGEPTLYRRLGDAIRLVRENGCLSFITTNGLLLTKKAEELVSSSLNVLLISLDGWDEPSQLKRGEVPGSFKKIFDGIKEITRLRGNNSFPIIRISTVITKENYHSIDKIGEVIYNAGVRNWIISNYFFITDAGMEAHRNFKKRTGIGDKLMQHHVRGSVPYFDAEQVNELKKTLARVRALIDGPMHDMKLSYDWETDLDRYYSPAKPLKESHCNLPYQKVDIFPDGRISLCGDGHTIGNILHGSIEDAWNGPEMKKFRNVYEEEGIMPMCFRCCGIAGSTGKPKFSDPVPALAAE